MAIVETPEIRARHLIQQLTEDFGWLEAHALKQPGRAKEAGQLRLAAALARNCIGPFLEDGTFAPLHIAVVGGAGAGKSTITNFLTGAVVAEVNPQAGFTRHPVAYTGTNGPLPWAKYVNFLGPMQRLFEAKSSNIDEDVYQVRKIDVPHAAKNLLDRFIVWDCPDMTTWAATGYVSRLIEITALADVVVYVASDERYNDEVPTQFLQLVLQAGKPVVTCIVKMKEPQAQAIVDHFRQVVVAQIPECTRVAACLAVPHLSGEELADPLHKAGRFRDPLVNQLSWWAERSAETRRNVVRGASDYLSRFQDHLLSAVRDDLGALKTWNELVLRGRAEFEARYRQEYLSGEKFPRFSEALVRLIQLLELPGIGRYVSAILWAFRWPYRQVRGLVSRLVSGGKSGQVLEEPVLNTALAGWLDMLHKEASKRAAGFDAAHAAHPLWGHVEAGFDRGMPDEVRREFQKCLREFSTGMAVEVEATARSIHEDLEKKPLALNALRGLKFSVEVASIGGIVATFGLSPWDLAWPFIIAPVIQEITEFLGKEYVDRQREKTRERQRELFTRTLAIPLGDWLCRWPATGGSTYERLQLALRRIPEDIQELTAEVHRRLGDSPP
jgi:50S ribosome-binding GTPase